MRGLAKALSTWLLVALGTGMPGMAGSPRTPLPQPRQILVKLKEPLARTLEAEWTGRRRPLQVQSLQSTQARILFGGRGLSSLRPLYPGLLELRRKTGWSDAQIAEHVRQAFPERTHRLSRSHPTPEVSRVYLVEVEEGDPESAAALLARLKTNPDVEYAEMNHVASANVQPNDPFINSSGTWGQAYQDLWGLYSIHAPAAWDTSTGSGMVVAVIDTGVDYRHPDIAANMWTNPGETAGNGVDDDGNGFIDDVRGVDFVGADARSPVIGNDPLDRNGHGTHVAGIIAASGNNGVGVIGVAWNAKIMALKGLDDSGNGLDTTLAPAILYAAKNGADVINASWGGQGHSQTIEEAIQFAYSVGVVFVSAAGNAGQDAWGYFPANSPEAITVAAVGPPTGSYCPSWSNYGTKIDVAAPGVDILSLRAAGSTLGQVVADAYMRLDGTSMAAPHVAGLAALLLSQRPGYPIESLRQTIRSSAAPTFGSGYTGLVGSGVLDAQAALALTGALQARIIAPTGRSGITGPVQVLGTAQGSGFDHYVLEYGSGPRPTVWFPLLSRSLPVANSILGTFDPSQLPDGTYTLRLTAVDTMGRTFQDQVDIDVAYLAITSPAMPAVPVTALQFKPGVLLQVTGKAGGPSFLGYRLEWAAGINPAGGWSSAGVTLAGGGAVPVVDGTLGTWDTTGIVKAGYYTIRLSADNAGFTSAATTLIHLEPDLLSPGWPKALDQGSLLYRGLVPVKSADGSRSLALVAPSTMFTSTTQFFRFSPDGQVLSAMAITGGGSNSGPSAGDVTGSGNEDVVFNAFENKLTSFRQDNSYLVLRPRFADAALNRWSGNAPLVELEGPGVPPSIVSMGSNVSAGVGSLNAWRGDGSMPYPRLASGIPDQNFNVLINSNGTPRVLSGDVNGDGYLEFVVVEGSSSSTYTLGLYALDGARIPWSVPVFSGYPTSLALADLDHNGCLETVLTDSYRTLHVFQPDGSERPGWPKSLDPDWQVGAVAIGDLAHTGREQIAVPAGYHLYLLNADGTPYSSAWPVAVDWNFQGHAALADVDGDGIQEVLVVQPIPGQWFPASQAQAHPTEAAWPSVHPVSRLQTEGEAEGSPAAWITTDASGEGYLGTGYAESHLVAYRLDGTVARSWNLLGAAGNQPSTLGVITVDDFDGDGRTDIAVTSPTIEGGGLSGWLLQGVATVLTTGSPYRPALNDWPTINRDARNSAVLDRVRIAPPAPLLTGVSPSPAPAGAPVVITGTGLRFASSVAFNGHRAAFTVDSDTSITATVPAGGASGMVGVKTPGGTGTIAFTEAPPVAVAVTPKDATALPGGQVVLAAEVTGTADTAVTWSIDFGGGALSGTQGPTVTFTAPAQPGTTRIRATSHADGTKTDVATVTVPVPITLTVTPRASFLPAGGQLALAAEVRGTPDTAVTWSIESGGGSLSGTQGQQVTFTAPAQPGTTRIRATSHADGTKTDVATVTVRSCDLNGDGTVDVLDLALLARAFNATPGAVNWDPAVDLDGDGIVGPGDLALFLAGM